jgi:hypothetical protein
MGKTKASPTSRTRPDLPEGVLSQREAIEKLDLLTEQAQLGGGADRINKQHASGKLTARERIALLCDEGSFDDLRTVAVSDRATLALRPMRNRRCRSKASPARCPIAVLPPRSSPVTCLPDPVLALCHFKSA